MPEERCPLLYRKGAEPSSQSAPPDGVADLPMGESNRRHREAGTSKGADGEVNAAWQALQMRRQLDGSTWQPVPRSWPAWHSLPSREETAAILVLASVPPTRATTHRPARDFGEI